MKIRNLVINKLHDDYNYDIKFNDDLTFLYGSNGCGKTTVLNILAAITTGKIYKLLDYTFSDIILTYGNKDGECGKIEICLMMQDENQTNMIVKFNDDSNKISNIDLWKERMFRRYDDDEFEKRFFSKYPITIKIKEIFNYVYLPLSRYMNVSTYVNENVLNKDDFEMYMSHRSRRNARLSRESTSYLNDSLIFIEELIRNSWMDVTRKENKINESFRNQVLSSLISVSREFPIESILNKIANLKLDDIEKAEATYIQTLKDIKSDTDNAKNYFKDFKNSIDIYKNNKNSNENIFIFNFVWKYAEFLKIENIVKLAQKNEQNKEKAREPMVKFFKVLDDFFDVSNSFKHVGINNRGEVYFDTGSKKLNLSELSSGEKQLVITFANLIFGFKKNKAGIFIVDEPEASLHLEWQSKFVSKILELDKNIQLVFATHSPELIGRYRKKAVKLVKLQREG